MTYYELIIYPPEDALHIDIYKPGFYAGTSNLKPYEYYSFIYFLIFNNTLGINRDYFLLLNYNDFNNLLYSICIKSIYFKTYSFLCFDVNFAYVINNIERFKTKKFGFGVLKEFYFYIDANTTDFDYFVIYNTNGKINEIIEIFNSSEYTPKQFVINETKYNYYSLYHVLYFDTTKILKSHPELNLNISKIKEEYDAIRKSIYDSFGQNNLDAIQVNFNKTTCRKKLISNEYECFICEIKMSYIFPLYLELKEINEDNVDTNRTKYFVLLSLVYSITNTCPEMNYKDIELLIKIKLVRITVFQGIIEHFHYCTPFFGTIFDF